ncbi:MAG: peroxide stress protein YaaA [Breznakibacter sp.]
MISIVSPAKNIDVQPLDRSITTTIPRFRENANYMVSFLKRFSAGQLADLYHVNPAIAQLNFDRFRVWDEQHTTVSKAASFAFNGEVYRGLDIKSFSAGQLAFAQQNLRILSGLYGLLKPLDAINPYRLEMGTHWGPTGHANLYRLWGSSITQALADDIKNSSGDKMLLNLASAEYFKAVKAKDLGYGVVNIDFKQEVNGKTKNVTVYAKRARGLMARFVATNQIERIEDVKAFDLEGYYFDTHRSSEYNWMFVRQG